MEKGHVVGGCCEDEGKFKKRDLEEAKTLSRQEARSGGRAGEDLKHTVV